MQAYRPEVWVEKDALVDVVGQACLPTRTPYFSCRGYVSQSEMYDAALDAIGGVADGDGELDRRTRVLA